MYIVIYFKEMYAVHITARTNYNKEPGERVAAATVLWRRILQSD